MNIQDENGVSLGVEKLGSIVNYDTSGVANKEFWKLAHWDYVSQNKTLIFNIPDNDVTSVYDEMVLKYGEAEAERRIYRTNINVKRDTTNEDTIVTPWYPSNYPKPYSGLVGGALARADDVVIYSYEGGYQVDEVATTVTGETVNYQFVPEAEGARQKLVCDSCHAPHAASTEMGTLILEHSYTVNTTPDLIEEYGMLNKVSYLLIVGGSIAEDYSDYLSNVDSAVKLGASRIHPPKGDEGDAVFIYDADSNITGVRKTMKSYSGFCRNCHEN